MNDNVAAVPTARWKCPTMYMLLCTSRFMLCEALISPPMPPKANVSMANI